MGPVFIQVRPVVYQVAVQGRLLFFIFITGFYFLSGLSPHGDRGVDVIALFETRPTSEGGMGLTGWRVILLMLPLGYGGFFGWQEWQFRQSLSTTVGSVPMPLATLAPSPALNTQAVATVLGLTTQGSVLNSAEPLILRATVVAGNSESRALLAGPEGERFYRAGERLPGGSLLRRIEPAHVVLWRQGREERLSLYPAGERFLQPADTRREAATARHSRPTVETSRSE